MFEWRIDSDTDKDHPPERMGSASQVMPDPISSDEKWVGYIWLLIFLNAATISFLIWGIQ